MFIVSSGRDYNPRELKPNPLNVEIYGNEHADPVLMDSLKMKGQIESIIIKEDRTIVSGHRRWLALREMGVDKIRCEVRAFDDELDEWETLIECNKQREKTRIQRANEIDKLRKIKEEKARRKMKASGVYGVDGGRPKNEEIKTPPQNSAEGLSVYKPTAFPPAVLVASPIKQTVSESLTKPQIDTSAEIAKMQEIRRQKHEAERIERERKEAEEEARKAEKAKRHAESETRNQIANEVGSSRYEVEMLEKLKAKSDSGNKLAGIALKDEGYSLNAGIQAAEIEDMANDGNTVAKGMLQMIEDKKITVSQAKKIIDIAEEKPDKVEKIIKILPKINEEKITVTQFVKDIANPAVAYNSGNNEWYTPETYIKAAYDVMGAIDLDPASSEIANKIVGAKQIYTADDDGLTKQWNGKVWMNPPYSGEFISKFCEKISKHFTDGEVTDAIVLVNNATETNWFSTLVKCASAVVFPNSRVKFYAPDGTIAAPLQGQAVVYMGKSPDKFLDSFKVFGWGAKI